MSLINDALKQASQAQRSQRAPRIPDEILKPADGPTPPPRSFFSKYVAPFLRAVLALGFLGGGGLLYYKWSENRLHESESENVASGKKSSKHKQAGKQAGKAVTDGGAGKTNSTDTRKQVEPKAVVSSQVFVTGDTTPKTNGSAATLVTRPSTNPPSDLVPVMTNVAGPVVFPQPPTQPVVQLPTNPVVAVAPTNMLPPSVTNATNVAVAIQQPFPRLRLTAIGYRLVNPWALINNQNVMVGDVVDEARVVRIQRSSVVFEFDGRTHEVWMLR